MTLNKQEVQDTSKILRVTITAQHAISFLVLTSFKSSSTRWQKHWSLLGLGVNLNQVLTAAYGIWIELIVGAMKTMMKAMITQTESGITHGGLLGRHAISRSIDHKSVYV